MTNKRIGEVIPDTALISAAHPAATPKGRYGRTYRAVYADGTVIYWAVGHAEAAKVYAREYGVRFLGGERVVSVLWAK